MPLDKSRKHRSLSPQYSMERLNILATPKSRHPHCMPDRPSLYWLDYIVDETPHTITDAPTLLQYYEEIQSKWSRLPVLSKPKPYIGQYNIHSLPRSKTACGISMTALHYTPSERIKKLAEPKPVESRDLLLERKQASRKPKYQIPWRMGSTGSMKNDLGSGDFPNRSKHRMEARSRRLLVESGSHGRLLQENNNNNDQLINDKQAYSSDKLPQEMGDCNLPNKPHDEELKRPATVDGGGVLRKHQQR